MNKKIILNKKILLLPLLYRIAAKAWAALYLPLQTFLISKVFSDVLQGYFFTFYSLIGLHIFAELGLYFLLVSFAAHEAHHLVYGMHGALTGEKQAVERIHSLGHFAFRWYVRGGLCLFFVLLLVGVFLLNAKGVSTIKWLLPWIVTCFAVVIQLLTIPALSLLEGMNQLTFVAKIQLVQSLLIGFISLVTIFLGLKLWSIPLALLTSSLWVFLCLFLFSKEFFRPFFFKPKRSFIWRKEIFPMQWRLALSCIADFFSFSFFTPLYFYFFGPILSGKVGMTLMLVSFLPKGIYIWTHLYTPQISSYIAQRKHKELFEMMKHLILWVFLSLSILIFFTCIFFGFVQERALPTHEFLCFLAGNTFLALGMPLVVFLRADKKEPLFPFSLCISALTLTAVFLGGLLQKPVIVAISYAGIHCLYLLITLALWNKEKQKIYQIA